jgi:hypothetical protein
MNKIAIFLLLVSLLSSCSKQSDNELLLKAYKKQNYAKCLKILQNGADGRINYSKQDNPLLFDICWKYLNSAEKSPGIESLLDFYLKNRKAAFEDSIYGTYPEVYPEHMRGYNPKQTVGSYLSRFATVELLQRIVQEKININSPGEYIGHHSIPAIYEIVQINRNTEKEGGFRGRYFSDWKINIEEKKIRIELLLDAGADVTLVDKEFGGARTIFRFFEWYPFEEDYTRLLDKMTEKGADLFKRDVNKNCMYYIFFNDMLDSNTEAYLEYLISRGLHVTEDALYQFAKEWFPYMKSDKVTETELRRLEKIKKILENDAKATGLSYDDAWKYGNNYAGKSMTSD